MEKYNIYRLLNNRRPASWQLPLTEVLIQKIVDGKDEGLKSIKYVKGVILKEKLNQYKFGFQKENCLF